MCLFFLFRNQSDFSSQRKTSRCIKESLKNTYPKLNKVDILNEMIEMEKSVILKKINPHKSTQHFHRIVKGNFSQSSIIFDGIGIGLQYVPNSVMSLIYNTLKPSHLWEAEDLDKVLQSGNILYNSIGEKIAL